MTLWVIIIAYKYNLIQGLLLIGECERNRTQAFPRCYLLIYQEDLTGKFSMLSKNCIQDFPLSEIDVVCDNIKHTKKFFVTNQDYS